MGRTKDLLETEVKEFEVISDEFSSVIRRMDIENAKQVLRENGYFVDNLWQTCDVKNSYECTEQEAYNVLSEVFDTDNIQQEIAEMIWHIAEIMNLKQID